MRLYKMELYKICSKKLFLFSAAASLAILLLYMYSAVIDRTTTINGVKYSGFQAVKMDQQITAEFSGELTDEKLTRIVEKYGFPSGVEERHYGFLDSNYLNDFVMEYFSDGYFRGYDDYQVATRTYPIAETVLGQASAATGKPLQLEYTYGWQVFYDVLGIGCILGMALMLLSLSPVYADESWQNTRHLLFTTKEGKHRDIAAKIAAGMTVAVSIFVVIVLVDFLFVACIYGLRGGDCFSGQVLAEEFISQYNEYHNSSTWTSMNYILFCIVECFLGFVEVAAVSLYFSSHCKSPFQAIIASAMCLFVPVFLNQLGRDNLRGIVFQLSQLSIFLFPGIALMSLVPDTLPPTVFRIGKVLCCVLPMLIGQYFRHQFPFYYSVPVMLFVNGAAKDLDFIQCQEGFSWVRQGVFSFAGAVSVLYLVCSWQKYKNS